MSTQYIQVLTALSELKGDLPNAAAIGVFEEGLTVRGTTDRTTFDHFKIRSAADDKTVQINSRNYTQASGSSIGLQSKPNQTVTTTGDVIGAEFSPRGNDADTGAIIAVKADPTVKDATAARTVSALRGLEINIDLPNAGSAVTFTNAVCGIRMFPDFGSGHTFSANRSAILLATPNTSDWTHLLEIESTGTIAVVTGGTFTTADGHLVIDVAGTDYQIPFYIAAD